MRGWPEGPDSGCTDWVESGKKLPSELGLTFRPLSIKTIERKPQFQGIPQCEACQMGQTRAGRKLGRSCPQSWG